MSKIITIAHQKGGVGKSTLALNLSYRFSKDVKIALTDVDPQGTIMNLQSIVEDFDIINFKTMKKLRDSEYDVVFIDSPPYIIDTIQPIFEESDFVLVPTKVGVPDIMAISTTIELIKNAQKRNKDLKAAIVLNMLKPNVKIKEQAIEQLEKYELPILSSIHDRISYGSSFLNGGVMGTNDSQAKNEIEKLSNEILNML
ncbi:ParA family protein [Empedobacter falsenii]|uniref:ParA family protein n=1 Tax=Empedobacter falsenii TaxID=343874 RepID=A0A3R8Z6C4_9FLAO|nr:MULTISPECIES: ParA family protein [Empedobacter]MDM1063920.1 ParA family protein [Empedobacter falsenii]MDM1139841.1 ParA family protein [Empedobacter sp. R132-2]MDM1299979.1 ParA family protein [Empedobacter falsenii]MDM1319772.1 ParA family protein [Empedobacter falsenii]MDM1549487.1 ParA family protein [Empedobacter falsenii]